jgi:hypothetical protein
MTWWRRTVGLMRPASARSSATTPACTHPSWPICSRARDETGDGPRFCRIPRCCASSSASIMIATHCGAAGLVPTTPASFGVSPTSGVFASDLRPRYEDPPSLGQTARPRPRACAGTRPPTGPVTALQQRRPPTGPVTALQQRRPHRPRRVLLFCAARAGRDDRRGCQVRVDRLDDRVGVGALGHLGRDRLDDGRR